MHFTRANFDFSISSNNRSPFVTSHRLKHAFKLCTYLSRNPITRTNFFNELNLPQSISFPTPISLPQKLTLALEPISRFLFPSKSTFFGNKNSCDGHISFLPYKNSGSFHHNKQLFNLPTEHSLAQISVGFKDVGTKPHFSTTTFSRIVSTLFWTQIFHSLRLCRIHHNAICESVQQKIFFTETSFSTANFTDTINLLNNKQGINSNRGTDNVFNGASLHLLDHNLTEPLYSQLTRTSTQAPYAFPELPLNPCNSTSRPSEQKTYLGALIRRNCPKSCKNLVHLLIIFLSFITSSHSSLFLQSS